MVKLHKSSAEVTTDHIHGGGPIEQWSHKVRLTGWYLCTLLSLCKDTVFTDELAQLYISYICESLSNTAWGRGDTMMSEISILDTWDEGMKVDWPVGCGRCGHNRNPWRLGAWVG